jgi:hypothetical protein
MAHSKIIRLSSEIHTELTNILHRQNLKYLTLNLQGHTVTAWL